MLLTRVMQSFARNIGRRAIAHAQPPVSSQPVVQDQPLTQQISKPVEKTGFEEMDVRQLQQYIDSAEDAKRNKDLNLELLSKIERKSARGYLQKTGLFTGGELKEMAANKFIEINKKRIDAVKSTVDPTSSIELKIRNPERFILPPEMKLFLFFKPSDFICTTTDPKKMNRPTIFDFIRGRHGIKDQLYCVVRSSGNTRL